MNIFKSFSLVGFFLIFLSYGTEAHMHAGLKGGFDKFTKNQGYELINFLVKVCEGKIKNFFKNQK